MASPERAHALDVRYPPPEPLARTLTAAEAAAEATQQGEYAVVPLAYLAGLQEVARLARVERAAKGALDAAERAVDGRLEPQLAFWAARRDWTAAYLALHAAVDGRPAGEEP